jgi:hypothetical protein
MRVGLKTVNLNLGGFLKVEGIPLSQLFQEGFIKIMRELK